MYHDILIKFIKHTKLSMYMYYIYIYICINITYIYITYIYITITHYVQTKNRKIGKAKCNANRQIN